MELEKGSYVHHSILKIGVITKDDIDDFYEVFWEEKPPFDYNTGINPCLVLKTSVKEYQKDNKNAYCDNEIDDDIFTAECFFTYYENGNHEGT